MMIRGRRLQLLGFGLAIGLLSGCASTIPFKTIDQGAHSGIEKPDAVVVRSQEEWRQLWQRHMAPQSPTPALPVIDFGSKMVIGVFLGQKPTGGYAIQVKSIERRPNTGPGVRVDVRKPQPSTMVTQAFTAPFHLISLERLNDPIKFERIPSRKP